MTASTIPDTRPTAKGLAGPDPAWRALYKAGGISAMLYVLFALVVPTVMVATVDGFWDTLVDAPALLEFISEHTLYWHLVQGMVLVSSIFMIVTFVAVFAAIRHLDQSWAAIAAVVSVVTQVLFIAYYPVLLGLAYLGEQYPAAGAERQAELATAADALIAQNSGFNPAYEAMMGVGILLFAIVMLKGVFPRWTGWLGVATFVAAIAGLSLYPVIGLNYLLWWVVFMVWFVGVGWKLLQFGRAYDMTATTTRG